jgi:hypothetical protein
LGRRLRPGEAEYVQMIREPGEIVYYDAGQKLRVVNVVELGDDEPCAGLLMVEPA